MGSFFKTALLLTVLTVLLVFLGRAFAGTQGMIVMLVFALVMNGVSYWFSDKIALGMSGAKEVSEAQAPGLYRMVAEVAQLARVPMPRVYVIESPSPNAFATGRDPQHAAVAVTTGIMEILSDRELRGVIAHELAHVRNRDTLIMTVVAVLAGAITAIAQFAPWLGLGSRDEDAPNPIVALIMIIVAPIAAMLIQMAISRTREFAADATGASITGDPLALAGALERLEQGVAARPMAANPAAAHLFIVNPLSGRSFATMFSTHPNIADRVARLRSLAMQQGQLRA